MLKPSAFHFIERFTQADLEAHPVWRHYEEARDRGVILSWGVSPEQLDQETAKFNLCGPEPLFPVLALDKLCQRAGDDPWTGLNIRVDFESPGGLRFAGYVIEPHAFGIFHEGGEFCFNRSLPSAASRSAQKLSAALGISVGELFPLRYVADAALTGADRIKGELTRFW